MDEIDVGSIVQFSKFSWPYWDNCFIRGVVIEKTGSYVLIKDYKNEKYYVSLRIVHNFNIKDKDRFMEYGLYLQEEYEYLKKESSTLKITEPKITMPYIQNIQTIPDYTSFSFKECLEEMFKIRRAFDSSLNNNVSQSQFKSILSSFLDTFELRYDIEIIAQECLLQAIVRISFDDFSTEPICITIQ